MAAPAIDRPDMGTDRAAGSRPEHTPFKLFGVLGILALIVALAVGALGGATWQLTKDNGRVANANAATEQWKATAKRTADKAFSDAAETQRASYERELNGLAEIQGNQTTYKVFYQEGGGMPPQPMYLWSDSTTVNADGTTTDCHRQINDPNSQHDFPWFSTVSAKASTGLNDAYCITHVGRSGG